MNWLKNRLKERTTLDGILMIGAGVTMWILPLNIISYALVGYGAYTLLQKG